METKILLVPSFVTKEELRNQGIVPTASVEAEYGENVIEGEDVTLAHHTKAYEGNPAPCNTPNVPVLPDGSTIVISHIDLDTLGGIAALLGRKKEDSDFWKAAEFIDLNGFHHLHEVSESAREQYLAYQAWAESHRSPRVQEITDVTATVLEHLDVIDRALDREPALIEEGIRWDEEMKDKTEKCLVYEDQYIRVFNSPEGTFCNASYYSPNLKKVIPSIVSFNGVRQAVTLSFEDQGKQLQLQARSIVQELWGPEAGGHAGIAGSPRGVPMTFEDAKKLAEIVDAKVAEQIRTKEEKPNKEATAISLTSIEGRLNGRDNQKKLIS